MHVHKNIKLENKKNNNSIFKTFQEHFTNYLKHTLKLHQIFIVILFKILDETIIFQYLKINESVLIYNKTIT